MYFFFGFPCILSVRILKDKRVFNIKKDAKCFQQRSFNNETSSERTTLFNGADESVFESIEEDKKFYNPRIDNLETKNAEVVK